MSMNRMHLHLALWAEKHGRPIPPPGTMYMDVVLEAKSRGLPPPTFSAPSEQEIMERALVLDVCNLNKKSRSALLAIRQMYKQSSWHSFHDVGKLMMTNLIGEILLKKRSGMPGDISRWLRTLEKVLDDDRAQTCVPPSDIFHDHAEKSKQMRLEFGQDKKGSVFSSMNVSSGPQKDPAVCLILGCKETFNDYVTRDAHLIAAHFPVKYVCRRCHRTSRSEEKIRGPHKVGSTEDICNGTLLPRAGRKVFKTYPMLFRRPMVSDPLFQGIDRLLHESRM